MRAEVPPVEEAFRLGRAVRSVATNGAIEAAKRSEPSPETDRRTRTDSILSRRNLTAISLPKRRWMVRVRV